MDWKIPLFKIYWDEEDIEMVKDANFTDPFTGQSTIAIQTKLYAGFHLFWGVFQRISGIS